MTEPLAEGKDKVERLVAKWSDLACTGRSLDRDEQREAERLTEAVKAGLFDIYRGEQLGDGKKSLAFQLTFCAADRSLEEKEINDLREAMLGPLEEKLGAKIRA